MPTAQHSTSPVPLYLLPQALSEEIKKYGDAIAEIPVFRVIGPPVQPEIVADRECIGPEIAFWRGIERRKPSQAGKSLHDPMDKGGGLIRGSHDGSPKTTLTRDFLQTPLPSPGPAHRDAPCSCPQAIPIPLSGSD